MTHDVPRSLTSLTDCVLPINLISPLTGAPSKDQAEQAQPAPLGNTLVLTVCIREHGSHGGTGSSSGSETGKDSCEKVGKGNGICW